MDVARLVASPTALTLSLALLHFLWQGLALATLAAAGLLALRRAGPNARYLFLLAMLLLMLAAPVATLLTLRPEAATRVMVVGAHAVAPAPTIAGSALPRSTPPPVRAGQVRQWVEARIAWFAAFWAVGVVALSLRLLFGWIGLASLRRRGAIPLGAEWQERLAGLAERLRVRRSVALLESARALAPTLVGWLRPAILLPAGAVIGLTPEQLEAVIAHELAHLRRHDYLVNLLQSLAETLLFYHPAVWWVSRRIRLERECCCDDLAVEACGDAMVYARALTALGALPAPALAPAATGGALSVRIRRLLRVPAPRSHRPPWLAGAVALAAVGLLIALLETPAPAVAARREQAKRMIAQVAAAMEVYRAPEAGAPVATPSPVPRVKAESLPFQMQPVIPLTTESREAPLRVYEVNRAAADRGPLVRRMRKLQFISPQFAVYQLGLSDDPGPEGGFRDPARPEEPALGSGAPGADATQASGGGGRGGAGQSREGARQTRLGAFFPEGISEIVTYPVLNSLLIRGTEQGVRELIALLELLDRKPRGIIIEAKTIRVKKTAWDELGVQWFNNAGAITVAAPSPTGEIEKRAYDLQIASGSDLGAALDRLVATSQAEVTDEVRTVATNLRPVGSSFISQRNDGKRSWRMDCFTPRINGDGTITICFDLTCQEETSQVKDDLSSTTTTVLRTTVNVRDGETFALRGLPEPEEGTLFSITATIVPDR